jgi:hypothetical protein
VSDYPVILETINGRAGQTLTVSLTWKEGGVPVDLTGWTAQIHVRAGVEEVILADLSSADGEIVLGGDEGTIDAYFTKAHTLAIGPGTFTFDLRLATAGDAQVVYLAEAQMKMKKPYTRPEA